MTDSLREKAKADSLKKTSDNSSPKNKNNVDKKGKKAGTKTSEKESPNNSSSDGKQDKSTPEVKASQSNQSETDAKKKFMPKQTPKAKTSVASQKIENS